MFRVRFCGELTAPPPPPLPEVEVVDAEKVTRKAGMSPEAYESYLNHDSERFSVIPATGIREMSRTFEYDVDRRRHKLAPGDDPVTIAGLELTVRTEKIPGRPFPQSVLEIRNTRSVSIAYRVETRPTAGTRPCHGKRDLPHNAVALRPGGVARRSECLFRKGWLIEIRSVEVVELPELGYFYLSSVDPVLLGLEARTARGHEAPRGARCAAVHAAGLASAIEDGKIKWRDLVDFYARHRCQTYSFFKEYRAFTSNGERVLPATPESY